MVVINECRKPTIALVDSGIDASKAGLNKNVAVSTGFYINQHGRIVEDSAMPVRNEHGTAIALIIKHLCENTQFFSINILNERLAGNGKVLIQALKHALSLKPDIIHLSLGTTRWIYKFSLQKIVTVAKNQGILIVAAAHNEGLRSYPACLRDVIAVKAGPVNHYRDFRHDGRYFLAPGSTDHIPGMDELSRKCIVGNSMAAAYITGHIARIKSKCNVTNTEIIDIFKKIS